MSRNMHKYDSNFLSTKIDLNLFPPAMMLAKFLHLSYPFQTFSLSCLAFESPIHRVEGIANYAFHASQFVCLSNIIFAPVSVFSLSVSLSVFLSLICTPSYSRIIPPFAPEIDLSKARIFFKRTVCSSHL